MLKELYQSATSKKDTLDDFLGMVEVPLKVSKIPLFRLTFPSPTAQRKFVLSHFPYFK